MYNRQEDADNSNIESCIVGEKCGTVVVSVYKETNSGSPIFYIQSDNENVLPISDIIENTLTSF